MQDVVSLHVFVIFFVVLFMGCFFLFVCLFCFVFLFFVCFFGFCLLQVVPFPESCHIIM